MSPTNSTSRSTLSDATTRLRHTFTAPDSDTDSQPSDLDETEQDALISNLTTSNDTANTLYTRVFTALPLLGVLPFTWFGFVALFGTTAAPKRGVVVLACLLAVTALLGVAAWVGFVPLEVSRGGSGRGGGLSDVAHAQALRRDAARVSRGARLGIELSDGVAVPFDVSGPVGRWIGMLSGVLAGVLVVFAVLLVNDGVGGFWLLCLLPMVLWVVAAVARSAMAESERGLRELRGLRYGYKGA
jgi:hypothetical protein